MTGYRVGKSVRVCDVGRGYVILLAPRRVDEPWPATRTKADSMPVTVTAIERTPRDPAAGRAWVTYVLVGRTALGNEVRSIAFYGINSVRLCERKR